MRWPCSMFMMLLLVAVGVATPAWGTTPEEFRAALSRKAAELKSAEKPAVQGLEGWYFLTSELRSYGAGPFWGDDAAKASVAEKNPDPLPAILAFHEQCKKAGVALIVVPVPGKVAIYPDKLDASLQAPADAKDRLDAPQRTFYTLLEKDGITVIDLTPDLMAMRAKGIATHCRTDTHWSPEAMALAAEKIATAVRKQGWAKDPAPGRAGKTVEMEVRGDLAALLKEDTKEKIRITPVASAKAPDETSPLVLAGDSHALVYHDPELLAGEAGLPEHLWALTGQAVDLVAARGSGANASRMTLARRKDNLAGKKCIVWVFTAREFTESSQGWQKIPVVR